MTQQQWFDVDLPALEEPRGGTLLAHLALGGLFVLLAVPLAALSIPASEWTERQMLFVCTILALVFNLINAPFYFLVKKRGRGFWFALALVSLWPIAALAHPIWSLPLGRFLFSERAVRYLMADGTDQWLFGMACVVAYLGGTLALGCAMSLFAIGYHIYVAKQCEKPECVTIGDRLVCGVGLMLVGAFSLPGMILLACLRPRTRSAELADRMFGFRRVLMLSIAVPLLALIYGPYWLPERVEAEAARRGVRLGTDARSTAQTLAERNLLDAAVERAALALQSAPPQREALIRKRAREVYDALVTKNTRIKESPRWQLVIASQSQR